MSPTIYPDRPAPLPEEPVSQPLPQPLPAIEPVEEIVEEDGDWESPFPANRPGRERVTYRGATNDPIFGYLVAVALCVGLIPIIPTNADLRYVILWTVLAGFGVLAWLLGSSARVGTETPENLGWGVIFGLIIGAPLLMVGGETLRITVQRLFFNMSVGEVLAFLVFVMPLAETIFFRGVLQETQRFWIVGVLSSIWSVLLFFPMIEPGRYPAVAGVIGTALVMMNIIYSYVRQRNGLAAAWICQIVVNLVLLFVPFI